MLNEDFGVWLKWETVTLGVANKGLGLEVFSDKRVFVFEFLWGNWDFSCTFVKIFSPVFSWFRLEAWVTLLGATGCLNFDCCLILFTLLHLLTWDVNDFVARDISADLLVILWCLSLFLLTVSLIISNNEAEEAVLSDSSHKYPLASKSDSPLLMSSPFSNTTSSYEPHLSSVSKANTSAFSSSPTALGASLFSEGWFKRSGLERQLTVVEHRTRLLFLCGAGPFLTITELPPGITEVPQRSVFGETKVWQVEFSPWAQLVFKSKSLENDSLSVLRASSLLRGFGFSSLSSPAVFPQMCLTTDGAYGRTKGDLVKMHNCFWLKFLGETNCQQFDVHVNE